DWDSSPFIGVKLAQEIEIAKRPHRDVSDDKIRNALLRQRQCCSSISCSINLILFGQQPCQIITHIQVSVRQEDAWSTAGCRGLQHFSYAFNHTHTAASPYAVVSGRWCNISVFLKPA